MKKLNKKQKTIIIALSAVLLIPLIVFSVLRETGAFDTRSDASATLTEEFKKADLNNDEKITIADFSIWLTSYRAFKENGKCPTGAVCVQVLPIGDLNNDGQVSIADFSMWLRLWRAWKGIGSDGDLCGSAENCQSGVCTILYRDADGDGHGIEQEVHAITEGVSQIVIGSSRIGICGKDAAYEGYVEDDTDCDDTNASVYFGSLSCLSNARLGGSYDSDCDGQWEKCDGVTCGSKDECVSNTCSTFCKYGLPTEYIKVCGTTAPAGYGNLCATCTNMLWWFDNDTRVCGRKNFCGKYMYSGLQTFETEAECKSALSGCSMLWWFDSNSVADTTTCHQKEFCGSYMYKGLYVFQTEAACNITLSQFNPSGTTDCVYSPSNVTNYYKCIENFCTLNGGTWVEDYYECENISEKVCSAKNGIFTSCASSCRHLIEENPGVTNVMCTEECVNVCNLSVK